MHNKKWTGELNLEVEKRGERSVASHIYFQGAFKLQRPVYHDRKTIPCYYLLNPGGGYLDGDTYKMSVKLHDKAQLTLTTQGATKVYKSPKSQAYQKTEIFLGENSYLEYLPDPLIAYRDAKFFQDTTIHLKKSSNLLYSDIITPGWSPDGNNFSYGRIRLKTEVFMENELVVFDHVKLEPASQNISALGFMENYTHLGTMIVMGKQTDQKLIEELYQAMDEAGLDIKAGISALMVHGFTIRVLSNLTQHIEKAFSICHHIISEKWLGIKPSFLRKY